MAFWSGLILITFHSKIELLHYNQCAWFQDRQCPNLRQILTIEIAARDIRIILPHHAPGFAVQLVEVVAGAIGVYWTVKVWPGFMPFGILAWTSGWDMPQKVIDRSDDMHWTNGRLERLEGGKVSKKEVDWRGLGGRTTCFNLFQTYMPEAISNNWRQEDQKRLPLKKANHRTAGTSADQGAKVPSGLWAWISWPGFMPGGIITFNAAISLWQSNKWRKMAQA